MISSYGFYLHFPVCSTKCGYCSFFSEPLPKTSQEALVQAIISEIRKKAIYFKKNTFRSIYFGGGTPSLLTVSQFSAIANEIKSLFTFVANYEWTVEANPESLEREKLECWLNLGVNRISIGVQSFQEEGLKSLTRNASIADILQSIEILKEFNVANWSLDLICGWSGQTFSKWQADLALALESNPTHLSIYPLSIEEGTLLSNSIKKSNISIPNDDCVVDMLEYAEKTLEKIGIYHYEISNYSRVGNEAIHNNNYWLGGHYLGIGPSASSFIKNVRSTNIENISKYTKYWLKNNLPRYEEHWFYKTVKEIEVLSEQDDCRESIILGTRLLKTGFDLNKWQKQFSKEFTIPLMEIVNKHVSMGLLIIKGNNLFFSRKGRWLANLVWSDLI